LEVCNCRVLCPCWIGEDPDQGTCDTIVAWHFDKGTVDGVDVAGTTIAVLAHVPGNILQGNWRAAVYVDDKVSTGASTTLTDTIFSTVPGAPVFVGKSPRYRAKNLALGIDLELTGHNALQSVFVFDA
jgi:hypothetical protein